MKALIVTADHELDLQDIAAPEPGPYDALVRILGCGICSTTDRELIHGTLPYHSRYPAILGHESVGEVVAVGDRVRRFRVGDRVTRPMSLYPGDELGALTSAWGGFAEYGLVRDAAAMAAAGEAPGRFQWIAKDQLVLPRELSLEEGILAISLSETAGWFQSLPESVGGKNVVVSGTGIAGLSIALWAKLAGARRVVVLGRRQSRLDLACAIAADAAVNVREDDVPARVRALCDGPADFFLEAVGSPDQIMVGQSVLGRGGWLAIYGVTENNGYDFRWTAPPLVKICQPASDQAAAQPWVLDLMRRGLLPSDRLMTHCWPFAQAIDAFAQVAAGEVVKGYLRMADA